MITSFISYITPEDYKACNSFRMKMTRVSGVYFFVCAVMGAITIYNTVTQKNLKYIAPFVFFVLIVFLSWVYGYVYRPKRQIKELQKKAGSTAFAPSKITVYQKAIEFSTNEPQEGEPFVQGIYPYSVLSAVFETDDAFYFFISSSCLKFVMKRDIPKEYLSSITNAIKSNCLNYRAVK